MFATKLVGDPITLTYYRNGERRELQSVTENPVRWTPLIYKDAFAYCMFAGMVFTTSAVFSSLDGTVAAKHVFSLYILFFIINFVCDVGVFF